MRLGSDEKTRDFIAKGWWGEETLLDLFDATAQAHSERIAVVDPLNREEIDGLPPRRLTYRELAKEAERAGRRFAALGLGPGDVIAFQLPNTVEQVVLYLAAMRRGLVISPVPIQWREHELTDVLGFVGAKAAVTSETVREFAHADLLVSIGKRLSGLEHILVIGKSAPKGAQRFDALEEADPAPHTPHVADAVTICWTSGTEARPKGVPRHHNHWISAGIASVDAARLEPGCVILNPFPFINMAAIGGSFVPWLLTGGTLVQHHPFDLPTFLKQIPMEKVNYTVAPPALLTMLLKQEDMLAKLDLSSLKSMGSGSAPLPPFMVKAWQEDYGLPIVNIFGSNEGTCLFSGADDVPDPEERARFFPRFGVEGLDWPAARMSGRIETKLADIQTGEEITGADTPGELLLKGATVFEGYFRQGEPGAPESPFDADGFFHTGDMFQIAGPGARYYQFVERAKDIIIRGGMNISPSELDVALTAHPDVAEAAVAAYADEVMGEKICAYVVPAAERTVTLDALADHLRQQGLAAYKLPEKLVVLDALPRNPLGKVLRRELKA
ncbi:MAG: class I adenylate-forming enzyme family protein [Parvibaculaceae bacterium]